MIMEISQSVIIKQILAEAATTCMDKEVQTGSSNSSNSTRLLAMIILIEIHINQTVSSLIKSPIRMSCNFGKLANK